MSNMTEGFSGLYFKVKHMIYCLHQILLNIRAGRMNSIEKYVDEFNALEQKIVEIKENKITQVYNIECFFFQFLIACFID